MAQTPETSSMETTDDFPSALDLEQALEHIRQLTFRNEELSHDLEDCRDQIFELLQKDNDIPEQSIGDSFTRIFEGIDSWIDDISSSENFGEIFKSQYQESLSHREAKFRPLFLPQACPSIEWLTDKLGNLETCRYVVLSSAIAQFLMKYVFRVPESRRWECVFPFGLCFDDIMLLVEAQSAMASDVIKKDLSQISRWKGEAVSALMATERIQEDTAKATAQVRESIQKDLISWISEDVAKKYAESFQTKVLDRAIHAVGLLGRSNKIYTFEGDYIQPGPVLESHSSWIVKDIATWRTIPSSDALGALYCLYPGLVRKAEPDEDDLTIIQPTLLGYKSLDLQLKLGSSRSTSPAKQEPRRLGRELSDANVSARDSEALEKKTPPETKPLPSPPGESQPSRTAKLTKVTPAPVAIPPPNSRGPSKNTLGRGSKPTGPATHPVGSQRYVGPGSPTREPQSPPSPIAHTSRIVRRGSLDSGDSLPEPSHGSSLQEDVQGSPLYATLQKYKHLDMREAQKMTGRGNHHGTW